MISTLLTLLTFGSGALGILGTLSKLLGKFAPGIASGILSNPITAAVGKVAEGFVDLSVWAAKGILGFIGEEAASGFRHIFSDGRSGPLFLIALVLAYEVGGWGRASPQAASVSPPVARSAPASPVPKAGQATTPQTSTDPFDWIARHFR